MFLGGPPPSNGGITAGGFGQLNQGGNSNPFGGSMDWGQGGGTQPPVSPFGSFGMNGGNIQPPAPQFDQGTLGASVGDINAPGTPLPPQGPNVGLPPMSPQVPNVGLPSMGQGGMSNGGMTGGATPPPSPAPQNFLPPMNGGTAQSLATPQNFVPPMGAGAGVPTNGGPLSQNSVASALSAGMAQL